MIRVDLAGMKLYALASSDWSPGRPVLPPVATEAKFFSKDEASLTMLRLYTSPLRAAWASVCWKHSSAQPWIVKVDVGKDMIVYRKSSGSEVYWTATVSERFVSGAATWFSWATAWPNEISDHILPIEELVSPTF